jgi:hypothetical protein
VLPSGRHRVVTENERRANGCLKPRSPSR